MNRVVNILGYQFYIREILVILFSFLLMENIFSWLVFPVSTVILAFEKVMSLVIFGFVLYHFTDLKRNEQIYIGVFCLVMLRLVFESLFNYGTIFQQLTMFTVLFPVVFTIFIKCISRSLKLDLLEFLAKFYLIVYVLVMIIYGRGFSFSLASVDMQDYGPFSGDSRIIHARSILMMIIPLLWFFSRFLETSKLKFFLPFLFSLVVIVIHQHRSVWASAIIALLVFFILSFRNSFIKAPKAVGLVLSGAVLVVISGVIVSYLYPQFLGFLSDRFSEILDPARDGGTGKFREDQREVYYKLFLKRPIFGWTFEGFDMPNPLVDWWPEKSGQHFHEGYMEMLFYHGIVGLVLKYWFLIFLAFKGFSRRLSRESIVLIAFSMSGLVFSFSYVLPLIFWGVVGLCLYYVEKADEGPVEYSDQLTGDDRILLDEPVRLNARKKQVTFQLNSTTPNR